MATIIQLSALASAGEASAITVRAFDNPELLTAVRNGSGNLELIGWRIDEEGKIVRAADSGKQAGAVSEIALTLLGRRAVTAVRSGSGKLLLISWDVPAPIKNVKRLADSGTQAGTAQLIRMTSVGNSTLVTAVRNGSGNLELISWKLQEDGTITRLGDSGKQAGEVSLVTVEAITSNTIVTAVRTGRGTLELIAWNISQDGSKIERVGDSGKLAGAVTEIAMVPTPFDQPGVLTAVRNGSGNLEVIVWRVVNGAVHRLGDSGTQAGTASHIAIGFIRPSTCLTSMRRGSGDLELIAFDVPAQGSVTRAGDFGSEAGTDVTETALSASFGLVVSADREANFLRIKRWSLFPQTVFPAA